MCKALTEMLEDERMEGEIKGRKESVIELLEDLGELSEHLRERIMGETDLEVLKRWNKLAARADCVETFQKEL